jgi:uncharacterized protein DUF4231
MSLPAVDAATPPESPDLGAAYRDSPAWVRLENQIKWYSAQAKRNQAWFKRLKVLQIVLAAAIPVVAGGDGPTELVGAFGALIVVLEGLQQLQQYQQNWTTYRSTAERLKHEKFLFLSRAGPYAAAENPEAMLAERVEGLVSQEHAAWAAHQDETTQRPPAEDQAPPTDTVETETGA